MASFQLPPLKNSEQFEHFVCELFNCIEQTDSYTEFQLFGTKGQNQKGIDIFSQKNKTVIQCKAKDIRGSRDLIRKKLLADIEDDLIKVQELRFPFERMIFASTFRDDSQIQEQLNFVQAERNYSFSLYYIGWDTLTHYAEDHENLLKKYFSQFRQKASKPQLPDGAIGNDLLKKNYVDYLIKRYGKWKQFELNKSGEKFSYARFKAHIMTKYKAVGINHIPVNRFDDVVAYLQKRIVGTAFGINQNAKGIRNYSTFDEYLNEIDNPESATETISGKPKIAVIFEELEPYLELHFGPNETRHLIRLKIENKGIRTLAGLEVFAYFESRFQNVKVPLTLQDENYELTNFNLPRGGERFVNLLQWRTSASNRIDLLTPPKYYPRNVFLIEPSGTNTLIVEVLGGDMEPFIKRFSISASSTGLELIDHVEAKKETI